jgi:hypothetical protein
MSAPQPGATTAAQQTPLQPKTRGFLHIARHGGGPGAVYVLTYHRLERGRGQKRASDRAHPRPVLAESPQQLIDLLERIGVDFRFNEVRGALADVLRLGSANIPDLWLSDQEMLEKGLVEA